MAIEPVAGDPITSIDLTSSQLSVRPERPLLVTRLSVDGEVHVTAEGEIDISTASHFRAELSAAMEDATAVSVDLAEVSFMDSQGLRVLIECRVSAGDRRFVVSGASPNVRRLIYVSGLEETFGMAARHG